MRDRAGDQPGEEHLGQRPWDATRRRQGQGLACAGPGASGKVVWLPWGEQGGGEGGGELGGLGGVPHWGTGLRKLVGVVNALSNCVT